MNRIKLNKCIFAVNILFLLSFSGFSQSSTQLLDDFGKKNFTEVRSVLEGKRNSGHILSESEIVLLIKTYNRLLDYDSAIAFNFSESFKNVENQQEFIAEKGIALFEKQQYKASAGSFINAYMMNVQLGEFAYKNLASVWMEKLTWDEIYELLGLFYNGKSETEFLMTLTVSNITNNVELDSFNSWVNQSNKISADKKLSLKNDAEQSLQKNIGSTVKVGLLLPLGKKAVTPTEKMKIGRSILTGFMTGLETVGISGAHNIALYVRDTEADSTKAMNEAKNLIEKDKVSLIIGPVFSDECYGVSKLAEKYKIPVISPTASDDELSKNSNYFFQMNPTISTRGRLSALEALKYTEIVKDTVLIVAEQESDAFTMGNAFEEVMKVSGVDVIDKGMYPYEAEDIRRYLPYAQKDTTQLKDFIYAPIEDDAQIDIVVPQLSYLKVFGLYVGNSLWDNRLKLRNYKTILNGMLICKDSHVDSTRSDVRLFVKNYQKKYYENPISTAFRGFDSFLLTKKLTEDKVLGLTDSGERIKNFPPVSGLQTVVSFNGQTVNQHLTFLRFINNEIIPAVPEQKPNAAPNK